ncbi:I78 family peptidase inhibitor [Silvimonas amylolytica]|uniref:Peptidase inhibitor I78 family protein n=1 Tax=Silvimonas amylolytica TaxID=449663 RepID=A0ABQ2PHK7_9NEIS|nr:I78 family peptidase inhibitor [Silvimonas amylolytica]GGP24866.1 hypothetical protein GCM10010971_06850 [Silvimonas amylolytica]
MRIALIMSMTLLAASSLTGCASNKGPATAPASPEAQEHCNADAVQARVGQMAEPDQLDSIRQQASAKLLRVIKPGDAVTMDYNITRLNLEVDEAGVIKKASCG